MTLVLGTLHDTRRARNGALFAPRAGLHSTRVQDPSALERMKLTLKETFMKTLILAALTALTILFGGCASTGDMVGTRADHGWAAGSDDPFE